MAKERAEKEVENLISIEGEKGFSPFDEGGDLPANDIVSSDQIDDVLMMFDDMDIDVVDDLQGHLPAKLRVLRQIHGSHAAGSQLTQDAVTAELFGQFRRRVAAARRRG